MRKTMSTLLAVTLLGVGLIGCGNSTNTPAASKDSNSTKATSTAEATSTTNAENTSKEDAKKDFDNKELSIAVFQGGYGADYWNEIVSKFESTYPGVKVNMTINPKVGEVIRPQIVAGNPPDFLSVTDTEQSGIMLSLIKEKGLLDISDVFESKALDKDETLKDMILPGMLDSTRFQPYQDGKIYLAPFNAGPMGLIYNKTLFAEKGWSVPETWDEFFALGDELKKKRTSWSMQMERKRKERCSLTKVFIRTIWKKFCILRLLVRAVKKRWIKSLLMRKVHLRTTRSKSIGYILQNI